MFARGLSRTDLMLIVCILFSFQQLLSQGNVFGTDAIIATMMTCTRSVYSWDIVVQVSLCMTFLFGYPKKTA